MDGFETMKLQYILETHKEKKKPDRFMIKWHWKNKKSDKYASSQITFCCDVAKKAFERGFISVETTKNRLILDVDNKSDDQLQEPMVCLFSMNDNGFCGCDDSCPHEEMTTPIKFCPFCRARIIIECFQKKIVTHTIKKVKKSYTEREDTTKVEIVQ